MQQSKKIVLGDGEVIGHKHVLQSNVPMDYIQNNNCIKLQLYGTGILTHDEHDKMVFGAGKKRRYHQVEFNPMDNSVGIMFD